MAFALVHAQQYGLANVGWIVFTGLMFAWALRRTGSLWTPIVLHVAINTVGVTAVLMRP
jgi:membrane protease YdiL (CAAX protease family)